MQEDELLLRIQNLNLEDIPEEQDEIPVIMAQQFHLEYLKTVPEFDGTPHKLSEYVRSAEVIINQYFANAGPVPAQGVFLQNLVLSALRTKLTGRALLVTSGREIATWVELKNILQRSFADQRSESSLLRDLMLLKQRSETAQEYFEICQQTRSLLYSNLQLNEQDAAVRQVKKTQYDNLTLTAYLSGLKEPLGSFLRSMRPATLEDAITYVIEEENVLYARRSENEQRKINPTHRKPMSTTTGLRMNNSQTNYSWQPQQNHQSYGYQQRTQQPFFPSNARPMSFPGNSSSGQHRQAFSKNSQMYPNRSFQQTKNVFAPQNRAQPRPTPMDTTSGATRRTMQNSRYNSPNNQRNFIQQSNQPRNFTSEELHYQDEPEDDVISNAEFDDQYPEEYYDDVEQYEEQDFIAPTITNDNT